MRNLHSPFSWAGKKWASRWSLWLIKISSFAKCSCTKTWVEDRIQMWLVEVSLMPVLWWLLQCKVSIKALSPTCCYEILIRVYYKRFKYVIGVLSYSLAICLYLKKHPVYIPHTNCFVLTEIWAKKIKFNEIRSTFVLQSKPSRLLSAPPPRLPSTVYDGVIKVNVKIWLKISINQGIKQLRKGVGKGTAGAVGLMLSEKLREMARESSCIAGQRQSAKRKTVMSLLSIMIDKWRSKRGQRTENKSD